VDELYNAFVDLMEAQKEYAQEEDRFNADGGSYWPGEHKYQERVDEAEKRFRAGFKEAVREALEEIRKEQP
jgi:hypothetical protein